MRIATLFVAMALACNAPATIAENLRGRSLIDNDFGNVRADRPDVPTPDTEDTSYESIGTYSYDCKFSDPSTPEATVCHHPDSDYYSTFKVTNGTVPNEPNTSNGYQFSLGGHQKVYLKMYCDDAKYGGTACKGNGKCMAPHEVHFDTHKKVHCSESSHNEDEGWAEYECYNKDSSDSHHANLKRYKCKY